MANPLTGDFEAVVQVSVRQINGLLATLHQNRERPEASPTFLHSGTIRIGQSPTEPIDPWVLELGSWFQKVSGRLISTDALRRDPAAALKRVPAGAVPRLQKALLDWQSAVLAPASASAVRGVAQVQVATPLLSLADRATDTVIVSTFARSHYVPDPGSQALPAPIHGEVWAVYRVQRESAGNRLVATPSTQDAEIQFVPASNTLSAADTQTIAREVRTLVRGKSFRPNPVELPQDFPFAGFIALGSPINRQNPGDQVLALPISLSGEELTGSVQSLSQKLISGTDDMAVALSREFVEAQMQPLTEQIRTQVDGIRIFISGPLGSTVYRGRLASGPTLQWAAGHLTMSARAEFKTDSLLPDQWVQFSQRLVLALDASSQTFSIRADGEPAVQSSACLDHNDTVARVKTQFAVALPSASAAINQVFATARERLRRGLRSFDDSASIRFQRLEVTPEGVILRGAIDTQSRKPTRVRIQPVVDEAGAGFTALESWVPGGRITRYTWSLARPLRRHILGSPISYTIPWQIERKSFPSDRHRFRLHWGTGLGLEFEQYSQVCLGVDGTQITAGGYLEDVTGFASLGGSCLPALPEPVVVLPPGWDIFHRPIWWPDWPDILPLDDGILAHVNCLAEGLPAEGFTANHLIHFVDWRAEQPLFAVGQALALMSRQRFSLAAVLVFPEGTLQASRQEMEQRLGLSDAGLVQPGSERSPVHFQIAEDIQGGWSRVFGTKQAPSSYLLNTRGELVWRQEKKTVPKELAAALDEFLLPAPAPTMRPMQLTARAGQRIDLAWLDDLLLENGLPRRRGRPAIIAFVQTWSTPCHRALRKLEVLMSESTEDTLFLGLCGDPSDKGSAALGKELALSYHLLHDAGLRIATRLKVNGWPTTLYISAEGVLDHVQFGSPPDAPQQTATAG